ncbi:hypothetical protein H7K32_26705 [Brevibacillus agri]|jgi:hypothetical protein|uniref:DUF1788 domain-containing protein n=1 Tax=Brevibacillus aydinogluensis TaxID=927786 RepID=A0AA48M4D5_9BACL|nr:MULTISPECIES: hypothetical protein [Brevibacillus]MBY0055140.1 hypothetical protein [Brevibacillus agri]CAJ1001061.1 DUF1788 domain-containing protein [Brevibacillus aydinogluensis]
MNKEELIRQYKQELKEGKVVLVEENRELFVKNGLLYMRRTDGTREIQVHVDQARTALEELAKKRIREMEQAIEVQRFLDE